VAVDKVKCPTCGTENSAKRQICHFCGQLLSAADTGSGDEDSLELVNEELKRAAEAAIRSTGGKQPQRAAPRQPQRERSSSNRITITSTSETGRRPAARPKTRKARPGREKLIVAVAAAVTVIALGFLGYRYLVPRTPSRPTLEIPSGSISLSGTPETAGYTYDVPGGFVLPLAPPPEEEELEKPATTTPQEPIEKETDFDAIAYRAAGRVTSDAISILSRVGSEIGMPLSVDRGSFQGTLVQKGVESIVVAVTFHGDGFTGSFNVLVRRTGLTWEEGWQAGHFSDFQVNFSPVLTTAGADGYEEHISAIRVGGGGFEPLARAAELPIRITYG